MVCVWVDVCVCVFALANVLTPPKPNTVSIESTRHINTEERSKIYFNTMFNTLTAYAEGERPLTLLTHALTTSKAK